MVRDMDIVRKVLLEIENQYVSELILNLKIDDKDREIINYHCKILYNGGFILTHRESIASSGSLVYFQVGGLTWDGHEFLDKIRDDGIWNQTKEVITKKGLPMALDVVKTVATTIIEEVTAAAVKGYMEGIK